MFTGIIESVGEVTSIEQKGSSKLIEIQSEISDQLKIDQSLSHDGVCLTVVASGQGKHQVMAVEETLLKSNLDRLSIGSLINLERAMKASDRFDGHIVQGHVDQIGLCEKKEEVDGSWLFDFNYDPSLNNITVEKGSVCINGVSLTCFNSGKGVFRVTIIPYTYENTNFKRLNSGSEVNLEFDIIGKYVQRILGK